MTIKQDKGADKQRKSLLAGVSVFAAAAAAAVTAAPPAMAQSSDEEIVVTGSRVARRDLVANSPITTVGEEELALSGVTSIEGLLNEMPQVVPGIGSTSNNPGLNGQATIDLRGLGPARTLVLIDGRRLAPSDKTGTVDLNLIPATLIDRIEVVTGGASAVYGSDAVAGVVNFILNDDFEGLEVGANGGISALSDAREYGMDFTVGGGFADGRGHATMFASYFNREVLMQSEREITAHCLFSCSSRIPSGTLMQSILNPFDADMDGVFTGNLRIDDAGDEYDAAQGPYDFSPVNYLNLPADRVTLGMFTNYDITDSIEAYMNALYTDSRTAVQLASTPLAASNGLTITRAAIDLYLPGPLVQAELDSRPDPLAPVVLQRRLTEFGPRQQEFEKSFYDLTFGLRGDLGDNWNWDAYYQFARASMFDVLSHDQSKLRLQQALNQCPPGSDADCVAIDPFGVGSITQPGAIEFIELNNVTDHHQYEQQIVSASINGELFQAPAGAVGAALGVEYRSDDLSFRPDPSSQGDLIGFNGVQPTSGKVSVREVFGELVVPLVADIPGIQYLGLELGARYSNYSSAGDVNTYKFGGEWQVVDSLRLRAMFNRATRAPTVFDLFRAGDQNFPPYTDPCRSLDTDADGVRGDAPVAAPGSPLFNFCAEWLGLDPLAPGTVGTMTAFIQSDSQVEAFLFGNTNLSPETSDTITVGAVFSHETPWGDIRATVDYYDVQVSDPIGAPTANTVIQRCVATLDLTSPQCLATPRLSSGQLFGIQTPRENNPGGDLEVKGIDVAVGYGVDVLGGRLDVNALVTYLDSYLIAGTEYVNTSFGIGTTYPEWKSNVRTTYSYNDWQFSWSWQYIGGGLDDYGFSTAYGYPTIDSINYHDFSVRWFATDNLEFTAVCQNCLDQEAQDNTISGDFAGPGANTDVYDVIGRYFRFGVRARF